MPPSSLCSACRNRTVSLGFLAEEMGMGMQVFYGDRRGQLKGRNCESEWVTEEQRFRDGWWGSKGSACFHLTGKMLGHL